MAAKRKNGPFSFLTEKRETYHRDVAGERADRKRAAKREALEEKARLKERADTQRDIQEGFAYDTGARHKREGKKPHPEQAVLVVPQKYFGVAKTRAMAKREYMKGYRANPNTKRNPEDAAGALSEAWHGRPAKSATDVYDKFRFHGVLTDLGRLQELTVMVTERKGQKIRFDKATRLCSSESGKQLYVVGGDQSLDLSALGIGGEESEKDLVEVGRVHSVVYVTAKEHLGKADKETGPYEHHLGGEMPILLYDTLNQEVGFAGGSYFIDPTDYDGAHSAGIRN